MEIKANEVWEHAELEIVVYVVETEDGEVGVHTRTGNHTFRYSKGEFLKVFRPCTDVIEGDIVRRIGDGLELVVDKVGPKYIFTHVLGDLSARHTIRRDDFAGGYRLIRTYNSKVIGGARDISGMLITAGVSEDKRINDYPVVQEDRNDSFRVEIDGNGYIAGVGTGTYHDPAEGVKADSGKRRYSLLPSGTLNEVVDVLEFGSRKYADDNWQKVDNARTRYYDATLRHVDAWFNGERSDSETGKHHLAHAICCLMFLMWFDLRGDNDNNK